MENFPKAILNLRYKNNLIVYKNKKKIIKSLQQVSTLKSSKKSAKLNVIIKPRLKPSKVMGLGSLVDELVVYVEVPGEEEIKQESKTQRQWRSSSRKGTQAGDGGAQTWRKLKQMVKAIDQATKQVEQATDKKENG